MVTPRRRNTLSSSLVVAVAVLTTTFLLVAEELPCAAAVAADGDAAAHAVDREAWARLQELGEVSDASDSLERTFLSPAARRAMDKIAEWMRDAGMETSIDEVGNVHGRVAGSDPDAKALMIGSHLDTVKDAGKYDGALGIIVGIAAVKALVTEAKATGVPIERPVHVVAFCDEEGVRFSSTFLGSRAVVGSIPEKVFAARDAEGKTFLDALRDGGFQGTREAVGTAKLAGGIGSYVEVHIEQGPVLQELGQPAAAVAGISGQTRLSVSVHGGENSVFDFDTLNETNKEPLLSSLSR